jgi:hypothetical protein
MHNATPRSIPQWHQQRYGGSSGTGASSHYGYEHPSPHLSSLSLSTNHSYGSSATPTSATGGGPYSSPSFPTPYSTSGGDIGGTGSDGATNAGPSVMKGSASSVAFAGGPPIGGGPGGGGFGLSPSSRAGAPGHLSPLHPSRSSDYYAGGADVKTEAEDAGFSSTSTSTATLNAGGNPRDLPRIRTSSEHASGGAPLGAVGARLAPLYGSPPSYNSNNNGNGYGRDYYPRSSSAQHQHHYQQQQQHQQQQYQYLRPSPQGEQPPFYQQPSYSTTSSTSGSSTLPPSPSGSEASHRYANFPGPLAETHSSRGGGSDFYNRTRSQHGSETNESRSEWQHQDGSYHGGGGAQQQRGYPPPLSATSAGGDASAASAHSSPTSPAYRHAPSAGGGGGESGAGSGLGVSAMRDEADQRYGARYDRESANNVRSSNGGSTSQFPRSSYATSASDGNGGGGGGGDGNGEANWNGARRPHHTNSSSTDSSTTSPASNSNHRQAETAGSATSTPVTAHPSIKTDPTTSAAPSQR